MTQKKRSKQRGNRGAAATAPSQGEARPPSTETSAPRGAIHDGSAAGPEHHASAKPTPKGSSSAVAEGRARGRRTVRPPQPESPSREPDEQATRGGSTGTRAKPPTPASKARGPRARAARQQPSATKHADPTVRGGEGRKRGPGQAGGETVVPPARRARQLRETPSRETPSSSEVPEPRDDQIWTDDVPAAAAMLGETSPPPLALEELAIGQDASAALRLTRGSGGDRLREAAAFGGAQSLLSTDYYFRQYGAHGLRGMAAEVDDFGFDPHVDEKARPLLEALCKRYFRVAVVGAEHIPEHGRALLVANRSGALPWDGLVLRTALRAKRPELATLRWLSEDSVIHYPFMGVFMNRLGAVRACPENAERLLVQSRLVAVFPEGAQGSRKLFRDRYRLQRFGRGGYVKLALKFGVPILPTAIIGGEETNPVLGRSRLLGRFVGSESVPLTPTFPWLGLAGLMPAPVKWRIVIGEPIDLSAYGPGAADDALVVHRLNEQIRSSLQALVDQGKRRRGGVLFG